MKDHHPEISEDRLFFFERQEVVVNDFDSSGYILDIGGGGRGVIGELKGEQVIAIDPSKRELEGAAAGPLKIIMDAMDLQFLDEIFSTATSFYTLMYIKGADHEKVFSEVFRVLTPGGRFLIWDAVFPPRFDEEKDIAVFPLTVKLPDEEIDAGYGVLWPEEGRDLSHYIQLAESVGFEVVSQRESDQMVFLELRKP
jgi:ubiquinone/menaquinone biosynthesis C-methylase UbiE